MNISKNRACQPLQRMSKQSLLALLPTNIDSTSVIVASTGEILSIEGISQRLININLNTGKWLRRELAYPRKLLLYNENWQIDSFNPRLREICVSFTNTDAKFSITIPS